jgi:hypothetical protein
MPRKRRDGVADTSHNGRPRRKTQTSTGGVIEEFISAFSPFAKLSKELQATLRLDRAPSCRTEHGRLVIVLRGGGLTDQPLEAKIALAEQFAAAARPLLAESSRREHRRYAERAISVGFEDEIVIRAGIATTRFTFLASHDKD